MIIQARKEACKSTCRSKHGAVITKGGSVVSKGYNIRKPHATYGGGPLLTLHAEAAAIRNAVNKGIDLHGSTIYVARSNMYSDMSKPCKSCHKMILDYHISKIVYTDETGNVIKIKSTDFIA